MKVSQQTKSKGQECFPYNCCIYFTFNFLNELGEPIYETPTNALGQQGMIFTTIMIINIQPLYNVAVYMWTWFIIDYHAPAGSNIGQARRNKLDIVYDQPKTPSPPAAGLKLSPCPAYQTLNTTM